MPAKPEPTDPDELGPGGRALWDSVIEVEPDMPEYRRVDLHEACRITDRLNAINGGLSVNGDFSVLAEVVRDDDSVVQVVCERALTTAGALADKRLKLIATLRIGSAQKLPAKTGSKPGVSRGPYAKDKKMSPAERLAAAS